MEINPLSVVLVLAAISIAIAGASLVAVAALVAPAIALEIFVLGGRLAGFEDQEIGDGS